MADAGEYICTAESDNAILSTSVFLQVQGEQPSQAGIETLCVSL